MYAYSPTISTDFVTDRVECSDYNGRNRREVYRQSGDGPFGGIAIEKDLIYYWIAWPSRLCTDYYIGDVECACVSVSGRPILPGSHISSATRQL